MVIALTSVKVLVRHHAFLDGYPGVSELIHAYLDTSTYWNIVNAVDHGYFHLVCLLGERQVPLDQESFDWAMVLAAKRGKLRILQWLRAYCPEMYVHPTVLDAAAGRGHMESVQWLHSDPEIECTPNAMDKAAKHGHLEMIQWLHENRVEGCTVRAMNSAAARGHLKVVQWLFYNRTEGSTYNALNKALRAGQYYVVDWLLCARKNSH